MKTILTFLLLLSFTHGFAQTTKSKKQLKAEKELVNLLNENFGPIPDRDSFVLVEPFKISDDGILHYTIHDVVTYRLEVPLNKVVEVFHDLYLSFRCDEPVVRHFSENNGEFTEFHNNYKYLFYLHIYGDDNEPLIKKIGKSLKKVQKYYKT